MKFTRVVFIVGYLFWGLIFLYDFSELMMKNAWVNLFKIKQVSPKHIEFKALDEGSVEITYEFKSEGRAYLGKETVINSIADRLPEENEKIIVAYNSLTPDINYLPQLDLKTRSGNVGMIVSAIFLCFLLLLDFFMDKKKWLKIYGTE